jgi:uncharacterized membrane protein
MSTGRLEAFSDGVLAIAITLLVLDLRLPSDPNRSIATLLADQWSSYVAYVVSFVVIGIMWVNHHALFRRVAKIDRLLLFLNLALLLLIAALPFPTAVAAEGLRRGGWDAKVAMFVYSVTLVLVSIAFQAVWIHIVRTPGILPAPMAADAQRVAIRRFGLGLGVYAALCGLAFFSPIATLLGHGAVAVYYAFEQLPEVAQSPAE